MSRVSKHIDFIMTAKDAGASTTFGRVAREMDRLKGTLGGRGPLKDVLELAVGGGAVAGIGFAIRMQANLAKSLDEVSEAYMRGEKSAAGFAYEITKAVPILSAMTETIEASGRTIARFMGFNVPSIANTLAFIDAVNNPQRGGWTVSTDQIREQVALKERRRAMGDKMERDAEKEFRRFAAEALINTRREMQERMRAFHSGQRAGAEFLFGAELFALGLQRDALAAQIAGLPRGTARIGATAESVTGAGLADVVAARATRTADPGVSELRKLNAQLDAVNKKMDEMNQRGRKTELATATVQGIFQAIP